MFYSFRQTNASFILNVSSRTLECHISLIIYVLQYSQDFGTIKKESLKRKTKWGAKYFTHDKSYYPVPRTSMEFANINFMQPLLSEEISPDTETAMKELVEKYRPVRQMTVRGETTKDKAGALPPAVYSKEQECNRVDLMEGLGNDLNNEEPDSFYPA